MKTKINSLETLRRNVLFPSNELDQPASSLYRHNLSRMMWHAVSNSNARYDERDTLERLDVRLLQPSEGDKGWDVFTLDYHVEGPIGTVGIVWITNSLCLSNKYIQFREYIDVYNCL